MLSLVSTWMRGHWRISSTTFWLYEKRKMEPNPFNLIQVLTSVYRTYWTTKHFSLHLPISKSLPKCLPDSSLLTTRGHSGSSADVGKNSGTSLAPPGGELCEFLYKPFPKWPILHNSLHKWVPIHDSWSWGIGSPLIPNESQFMIPYLEESAHL